jgi:glucose-6-phosphate isomerase
LFNINTYNQPAVELGKEATFALMGRKGFEDLQNNILPFSKLDKDYLL